MLQPEALYLSFSKVYSITDQSSNDNLMFFKVIYCCINFPLLSCGLRLSVSLGVYSKVKRLCKSRLFPSGSSNDCRSGDESGVASFHQGSVLIYPRKFRLSFFCQVFERLHYCRNYLYVVAASSHCPIADFLIIRRPLLTLALKSIFHIQFLST